MRTSVSYMEVSEHCERRPRMSGEVRPDVLSTWFERPSPERVSGLRLTQWRANYDEAVAIARFVRWMAERNANSRRAPGWRTNRR
jgi:hypothetical protein